MSLKRLAFVFLLSCCSLIASTNNPAAPTKINHLSDANPFCGTTHDGGMFPGAVAPFGMLQWSPDTGKHNTLGGYNYKDSSIFGFSLDHMSGAGSWYGENFAFMPVVPAPDGLSAAPVNRFSFSTRFSHRHETARPGFYSVTLDNGFKVELTATPRSGFARFTSQSNDSTAITINAGSNINGASNSTVQIDVASRSISGWATGGRFLGHPNMCATYFYAVFNRPFQNYGVWSGTNLLRHQTNARGRASGAYLIFDTSHDKEVLAKVAISYVSVENAKANLESENPTNRFASTNFDRAVSSAGAAWNRRLKKIEVTGGTAEERRTFYSMFYHALLAPSICSDVNGEYRGYDGKIHRAELGRIQYGSFSGWDIYRSECQFLAMIAPEEASDMVQSLLLDYEQGGAFPRWGLATEDSGVMDGDPSAPIIAGMYAFGAKDFDVRAALKGLVNAATNPAVEGPRNHIVERDALADYLALGYVPEDQHGVWGGYGNASMTLEYASADFAVSQLAEAVGDESDSAMLLWHSHNWKNLFNRNSGYIEMRRRDGDWAPNFTNDAVDYDHNRAYQEGSAEQYVWMVPFDYKSLVQLLGGPEAASARLDKFFTQLNAGMNSTFAYMGNEPCLETPWIYDFLGKPYKTTQTVHRILRELYSSAPDGLPGNDDLGELSSWYVFAALGMYPEIPGTDVLVLSSPIFPKAVLHLEIGDVILQTRGQAYVQNLILNGQNWNKPWIRFQDISGGATMDYNLGSKPNPKWGSDPTNAPPSYN